MNERTADDRRIPDNERWLYEPAVKADLDKSIAWAESHPPAETDLDELEARIAAKNR